MKSNIKKKAEKAENKVILSIGMIVKNEEKHLDKCLSALQKLRDKVPNELIIVDTGSTDRTKEIALRYTDMVYDFEWINDFSAARNCGLEKATGEWFMFIDADEYLDEDCEEMVQFFNNPEVRNQYNSASFYMRNYSGKVKKASNQFLAPRIVRNFEGLKFHDPIHEWIPQPLPHGIFTTVFHHYGYAFTSKAEKDKKSKRNMEPLLKEYEETPDNLRTLYHLCDAIYDDHYFETAEIKEKYLDEYLEKAKEDITEPYAFSAYIKYAIYYAVYERYDEAIELLNEFVEIEEAKDSIIMLTAYHLLVKSYMNKEDYENAYNALEGYFKYYHRYEKSELGLDELRYGTLQGISEYDYEESIMYAARCLNYIERYDEAIEYLDKADLSEMNFAHLRLYMNVLRDLIRKTKRYSCAASCYEKILEMHDDDKTGLILFLMEQYYLEHLDERENFIREIAGSSVDGKYIELANIIKDDIDGKDISMNLSGFIDSIDRWNEGYSEAIFLAMKHGVDVTPAIEKMSHNVLKDVITNISDGHPYDYAETALGYCADYDYGGGIRQMFWCVTALEAAVHKSNELNSELIPDLYDFFVCLLSDYVSNIYNPELLNPEDIEVLPELHRFGYYITVSFNAKNEGDLINYVRNMKEALRLCEPMKDVVSFYLNELEEEMRI